MSEDNVVLCVLLAEEFLLFDVKLVMRPLRKYIREFSGSTGPYTIKARVIEITNVHSASIGQPLELQEITFEDEEGTKMKTYLFNESLEIFEDVIQENMEYDIYNASLKPVYDDPSGRSDHPVYELFFNINTIIQPVSDMEAPEMPNYILIGSIPRKISLDDRYDVLGVVIYVDRCCQVTSYNGLTSDVCEVVIVDHSHHQVMVITAWSDLAIKECAALHSIATSFPVVGFTALMPSYQKGFSLTTTHASFVILNPQGEQADKLKAWARENKDMLAEKNHKVFELRLPVPTRRITTIESLLEKNTTNTLQGESHWLHVKLNDLSRYDVHLYLGCSLCGASSVQEEGVAYICIYLMTITFEAVDASGEYTLTACTHNAERLLEVEATVLYAMPAQERESYLKDNETKLQNARLYVQVVSSTALSRAQQLEWVLKQISLN
ncbi:replication protein A 70 kDa DNA-binding subunit B-like [Silene latifolia]|uniref:replication protein A 70 kDa DNA-binding subunit B-like n=1 Tax=Silene latifolia TaxID=37657 RepID=UPI003D778073